MSVHLLKVAVGIAEPGQLSSVQKGRRHVVDGREVVFGYTRRMPKRRAELIDGGSIFWIIRHVVLLRQRILDMVDAIDDEDGTSYCRLLYDPELVAVQARPCRAFQGWRYLKPAEAPRDLSAAESDLPAHLQQELRALGLL